MKYEHLIHYVAQSVWAILPEKLAEIAAVLSYRAAGHRFTAEEIQARIGDGGQAPEPSQRGAVAIVPLRGVIAHRMSAMEESSGGMSTERFTAMFRQAMASEQVGTILLDVDSPGGTVTGVPEAAAEVFAARGKGKRIVAMSNGMMCSAAYWIASQADEIVSLPSGIVGSIGVFTAHADLSAALEKEGVKVTMISAGKFKTEGNPYEPLSDEGREFLRGRVDDTYALFVKDVARARGVSVADVRGGYGQGRALPAKDAKAAGLIDRIATMDGLISGLVGGKRSGLRAEDEEAVLMALQTTASTLDADRRRRMEW